MQSPTKPPRAIIYIPFGVDTERWERSCYRHCRRRGYDVISLVIDDEEGSKWQDVVRMFGNDSADVAVVFDLLALPASRLPRMEEVEVEATGDLPRSRRPRLFRRSGN